MRTLTRVTTLTAVLTATLLAQRPFGVLTSSSRPDPATMIQNQVERLTALLSLTTAQQTQATTIFTNAQTAITPLQTTVSTDYQSLKTAVKSDATATIDSLSSSIGTLTGQITAIQNKADASFYAILTADQQSKLNQTGFGSRGGIGPGPGPGFGPHP